MFSQKIVILGYGAVSQCLLPLACKHFAHPKQITIVDCEPYAEKLAGYITQGVTFIQKKLNQENCHSFLQQYLKSGDLLIDLAVNIHTLCLIKWAHEHNVMYLNTAIFSMNYKLDNYSEKDTLYHEHKLIKNYASSLSPKGPTILLEHGANPGLISHLTKKGLLELGEALLNQDKAPKGLEKLIEKQDFAQLARALEIKVIHVSERDTQISVQPKKINEFVNTWSVTGFVAEAIYPSEMGWGTHEKSLPHEGVKFDNGIQNCIWLKRAGKNVWVKSWVPHQAIIGLAITHGESITIANDLTIYEKNKPVYSPTVHYAYCPTDYSIASLHELEMRSLQIQPNIRIMNDDIVDGQDILGVLLMGNPHMSWWTGSLLSIQQTRDILPNQSATTLQVAGSILSALMWMKSNTNQGVVFPEQLPWQPILKNAEKFWGGFYSTSTDWYPNQLIHNGFERQPTKRTWQFKDFFVDM